MKIIVINQLVLHEGDVTVRIQRTPVKDVFLVMTEVPNKWPDLQLCGLDNIKQQHPGVGDTLEILSYPE